MEKEKIFIFQVDAKERSWFINFTGQKLANSSSHKQLLKDSFPEDWKLFTDELSQKNKDNSLIEAEAEKTLTHRLLKTRWVKIGEIGGAFYLDTYNSGKEIINIASRFAKAILKSRADIGNNSFIINNTLTGVQTKHTVRELERNADE